MCVAYVSAPPPCALRTKSFGAAMLSWDAVVAEERHDKHVVALLDHVGAPQPTGFHAQQIRHLLARPQLDQHCGALAANAVVA